MDKVIGILNITKEISKKNNKTTCIWESNSTSMLKYPNKQVQVGRYYVHYYYSPEDWTFLKVFTSVTAMTIQSSLIVVAGVTSNRSVGQLPIEVYCEWNLLSVRKRAKVLEFLLCRFTKNFMGQTMQCLHKKVRLHEWRIASYLEKHLLLAAEHWMQDGSQSKDTTWGTVLP